MKCLFVVTTILLSLQNAMMGAESPWQETRVADFSRSHSVEALTKSNVLYSENLGRDYGRGFSLQKQNIVLRLPGGREIQQKIERGSASAIENELVSLSMEGPVLPIEDAYRVATEIHRSLGLSTQQLAAWYEANKDKGRDIKSYTGGNTRLYPTVNIEILPSMNERYPWFLGVTLGWNNPKQRDWNEAKAAVENRPPPPGLEKVSLDSPSGTVYERTEAYQHLAEKASANRKTAPTPDQAPSTPEALTISTPDASADLQKEEKPASEPSFPIVPVVIVVALIAGAAVFFLRRKS